MASPNIARRPGGGGWVMKYRDPGLNYRERVSEWHRWFAWHSVAIEGTEQRAWLEWVERRRVTFEAIPYYETCWRYRTPPMAGAGE